MVLSEQNTSYLFFCVGYTVSVSVIEFLEKFVYMMKFMVIKRSNYVRKKN